MPCLRFRQDAVRRVAQHQRDRQADDEDAHFERPAVEIGRRLEEGRSVAFVTEGDPSLFSTFVYLQREARERWPQVNIEVVPGVSSVMAVPAAATSTAR